jgi:transaldolase
LAPTGIQECAVADRLDDLTAAGVSIWLDDLSRKLLATGALQRLVDHSHVVGITSNPTIFATAIGGSVDYDDQIRDLGRRGASTAQVLRLLTVADVRSACDVLRPVYDATDSVDGRVSIEVDPRLAHDTADAITEARQLWRLVDRPNLFIKIPATKAGLPAIAQCLADGISVNVTLIFSLRRYAEVIDAFLDGMEQARSDDRNLSALISVASFFVSRVDTEIDNRLDRIGAPEALVARCPGTFTFDFGEDLVGGLGPDEGMPATVPAVDECFDLDCQVAHGGEAAAPDGLAFDDGEPDLDQVQPGAGGGGEVEVDPRVRRQPRRHFGPLVGGVVVHHQMQLPVGVGPGQVFEEGEELLVAVPVLAQSGDLAGSDF